MLFAVLITEIPGCKAQVKKQSNVFTRYLPDLKNGTSNRLLGLQANRDSLKLDTLENGYDSIQIRIWATYARKDSEQVISIKRHNHQWSASYCLAAEFLSPQTDSLRCFPIKTQALYPKSNWQEVLDSLISFDILLLPNCTKVKGYMQSIPFDGGNAVTIEVSTVNLYRMYMYALPSSNKDEFKEAASVDAILNLLSYEFGVKYLGKF